MAFVGVGFSYEAYYQAVRRCWRFGQTSPVDVHVFGSDGEAGVLAVLRRKEDAAAEMVGEMVAHMAATMRGNLAGGRDRARDESGGVVMRLPEWLAGVGA